MGVISCNCNCDNDKLGEKDDELKFTKKSQKIITSNNSSRKKDLNQYNINKETTKETTLADKTVIDNQNNLNKNDNNQNDFSIIEVPPYIEFEPYCENMVNNNINNNKEQSENYFNVNDNTVIDTNINTVNQLNNIKFNNVFNDNDNNCEKNKIISLCTSNNNNTKSNNTVRTGDFCISNTKELKNKIKNFKIDKIEFGLESNEKENLSKEKKELYSNAEKNLNQFLPPQNKEIQQIRSIMENIVLNLNNVFQSLNSLNPPDNEEIILFSGNLKKLINYEINTYKTTLYSDRFCVLYPKMLKYYKSKAQFLKNLKPLCVLPISQISKINIAKSKKSKKKINHLIICNKYEFQESDDTSIFLNFFDTAEVSQYSSLEENHESLLIFTNDDENIIYKWYIIIQILIDNLNK